MPASLTKAERRELDRFSARTYLGWGLDAKLAAKRMRTWLGGLVLALLFLLYGTLDLTRPAQRADGVVALLVGVVLSLVAFPFWRCLRAWQTARKPPRDAIQIEGHIVFIERLPSGFLGSPPNRVIKLQPAQGRSRLFLVGPRFPQRLHPGQHLQLDYLPTTGLVTGIRPLQRHRISGV